MGIEVRKDTIAQDQYLDVFNYLSNKTILEKFGFNSVSFMDVMQLNDPLSGITNSEIMSCDAEYFKITSDIFLNKSEKALGNDILKTLYDIIPEGINYVCNTDLKRVRIAQAHIGEFIYDLTLSANYNYYENPNIKPNLAKKSPTIEISLQGSKEISIENLKTSLSDMLYLIESVLNQSYQLTDNKTDLVLRPTFDFFTEKDLDDTMDSDDYIDTNNIIKKEPNTENLQNEDKSPFGTLSFDDIGGNEDLIDSMKDILYLLGNKQLNDLVPKGVLLHGPPGTGKTMVAKAMLNAAYDRAIITKSIKTSDFKDMWYGNTEKKLKKILDDLQKNQPSILFVDEGDSIFQSRIDDTHSVDKAIVNALLSYMDGSDDNAGTTIITTTNLNPYNPLSFDPAFIRSGRFSTEYIFKMDPPNTEGRKKIIDKYMIHEKYLERLSFDIDADFIAKKTEGFNGSDISEVFNSSLRQNLRKSRLSNKEAIDLITEEDLIAAIGRINKKAVSEEVSGYI
ncbi:MAG: ATP-binding protein [DPANN group archaeon]|nr:ATP-binding protein [DPANN group archaeon]